MASGSAGGDLGCASLALSAAAKLAQAAEVIQKQPVAIQLRYLQTLVEIGTEKNTTIVFPLPVDFLSTFIRGPGRTGAEPPQS